MTDNPLIRVLQIAAQGRSRSLDELARELRLSEPTLRQILTTLAERGYLQPVTSQCTGQCTLCPLQERCLVTDTAIWVLSDKGRKVIAQWEAHAS